MKKQENGSEFKKMKPLLFAVVSVAIVILIGGISYKAGYENGFKAGEASKVSKTEKTLEKIAELITEKNSVEQKARELKRVASEKFDSENIVVFKEKLHEIYEMAKTEEVKSEIGKLEGEVEEFETIFSSENNDSIGEKLTQISEDAKDIETTINEIYSSKLGQALKELVES